MQPRKKNLEKDEAMVHKDESQEIESASTSLSQSDITFLKNLEHQITDDQVLDLKPIKRLLRYIQDNKIQEACKLWKKHLKEVTEIFNWDNAGALGLKEEDLRCFLEIVCKRQLRPAIECLFVPAKFIVGTDAEKKKAYKAVLRSQYSAAIKQLDIKAYLALHITDAEKKQAYKDILSSQCPDAIKQLDIEVYLALHTTVEEKKKAYKDILSSHCREAIKQLKIKAYLALHVTEEEKKQAYKDVLASQCPYGIKQLDIKVYLALHTTDEEKKQAYKDVLASHCADAINQLDINAYLALYTSDEEKKQVYKDVLVSQCRELIRLLDIKAFIDLHTTNEEKRKAYKAILSSRCPDAIKHLDIKAYIDWHVTDDEKKQAYKDVLASQYSAVIKHLDIKAYIGWHVTEDEKKKAYKDILTSHCQDAIKQLDIKAYLAMNKTDDEKVEAITHVLISTSSFGLQQIKDLILDWQKNNPEQLIKLQNRIRKNKTSQKALAKILFQSHESDLAIDAPPVKKRQAKRQKSNPELEMEISTEPQNSNPEAENEPSSKRLKSNPKIPTKAPKMTLFGFLEQRHWQEKQKAQRENLIAHPFFMIDAAKIPTTPGQVLPINGVPAVFFKPVPLAEKSNRHETTKRKYGSTEYRVISHVSLTGFGHDG